jgi:hypothetical protein
VFADQLLAHLPVLCVVRSAEGDVMNRTASLVVSWESRGLAEQQRLLS